MIETFNFVSNVLGSSMGRMTAVSSRMKKEILFIVHKTKMNNVAEG